MTPNTIRAWNADSEVRMCATCNGLGVIASLRRPTIDDPYPERPCPDCDGQEHDPMCDMCGFGQDVAGYDCLACDTIGSLTDRDFAALNDAALAAAIMRAAAQRRRAA